MTTNDCDCVPGHRCDCWDYRVPPPAAPGLRDENERLRAAVIEGDRRIAALMERIHPTLDGYCPACGGGCLIGFATPTPARDAVR